MRDEMYTIINAINLPCYLTGFYSSAKVDSSFTESPRVDFKVGEKI